MWAFPEMISVLEKTMKMIDIINLLAQKPRFFSNITCVAANLLATS